MNPDKKKSSWTKSRAFSYGTHSLVTTLLVTAIIGVINFLGARNQAKLDLTRNKVHTLSEQTKKVVSSLKSPIKAVYFAKLQQREQFRPFLENYRSLNPPKFTLEYVDPDKDPIRTKQAGIKKYGTLQLVAGERDTQVDEVTEEKITNGLLKILKDKNPQLCVLTGHGEKSFSGAEPDAYGSMRKELAGQAFDVQEISLVSSAKIPETCSAVAIWGPSKAFFPQEVNLIREYSKSGGSLLVGADLSFEGTDAAQELNGILAPIGIKLERALLVDPAIRTMELDSSVLIVNQFAREQPITREITTGVALPFARPLTASSGQPTALLTTSTKAWGESNLKELLAGRAQFTAGQDTMGALHPAMAVEMPGSGSKKSRSVVFGSASFANNTFSRMLGNSDLFLNAAAWVLEDDSSISIRPKEQDRGKIELSQKQGVMVFVLTVILMPLGVGAAGVAFWARRRRL